MFSNGDETVDDQPSREDLLNPNNWVEFSDHNEQMPGTVDDLEPGDELKVPWGLKRTVEKRVVDIVSTHPTQNTLHAWVHTENPHGVFAGFNPAFDRFDPPGGGHDHEH